MWLFPVFRKPLRADSRKPLNLYGGKWAVQVFRNQLFLRRYFESKRFDGFHVGHPVPVEPARQFLFIGDLSSYEYVEATSQVGDGYFERHPCRICLPALEAKTAPRHVFTLDDYFLTAEPNAGRGFHGRTSFSSSFPRDMCGDFSPPIVHFAFCGPSVRHFSTRLFPDRRGIATIAGPP